MNLRFFTLASVLAVAVGVTILISFVSLPGEKGVYSQWKSTCRVSYQAPFEDKEIGIMFDFNSDVVVCSQSTLEGSGALEIYLVDKSSFGQVKPRSFADAILGKIVIASSTLYKTESRREVVGEEVMVIAGRPTIVRSAQLEGCRSRCLIARIAEIERNGKMFLLEEYAARVGLLESFRFQ